MNCIRFMFKKKSNIRVMYVLNVSKLAFCVPVMKLSVLKTLDGIKLEENDKTHMLLYFHLSKAFVIFIVKVTFQKNIRTLKFAQT